MRRHRDVVVVAAWLVMMLVFGFALGWRLRAETGERVPSRYACTTDDHQRLIVCTGARP